MAAVEGDQVPSLRGYRDSLSAENRQMYDEKLKIIAGIDPYSVSVNCFSQSMTEWPEIEFPDIVNYLLFSTSKFTKEQVKAYKSLQSYQYFVAGWVRSIFIGKATQDTTILIGKVRQTRREDICYIAGMMMSISLQHLPKMDRCFILLFIRCCFSYISLSNYFKVNHSQRLSEAPLVLILNQLANCSITVG